MTNSFRVSTTLLLLGIMGTVLAWLTTSMFLVEVSLGQFVIIEILISLFHSFYNRAKKELKPIK